MMMMIGLEVIHSKVIHRLREIYLLTCIQNFSQDLNLLRFFSTMVVTTIFKRTGDDGCKKL